jgi:hypothetical protein
VVAATVVRPAEPAISPPTQSFTTTVGDSVTATFTVANGGGSATGPLTAVISAGAPDFAVVANDCGVPLPPLGVCKILVTFTPSTAGAQSGILTVVDTTPGSMPVTATLAGTGIYSSPTLIIRPGTSDFGTVLTGATKTTAFTFSNNSGWDTDVVSLATSDPQFTIGSDLCSGHPLLANSRCTFTVTFVPAPPAGLKQAIVRATQASDGALLASASLSGTAALAECSPWLAMTPSTLDFQTTAAGTPVGPLRIVVAHRGCGTSQPLSVSKQDSTSSVGGASQFTFTSTCVGAILTPDDTCQVDVTFAPTKIGSFAAVLTVSNGSLISSSATVIGEAK